MMPSERFSVVSRVARGSWDARLLLNEVSETEQMSRSNRLRKILVAATVGHGINRGGRANLGYGGFRTVRCAVRL